VVDTLRIEFTEGGPSNIPEFGSVTTEHGLRCMRIIDSYRRVRDGVPYPAVLLTTGRNDPRVPSWQAAKMTARLQAATGSDRPVLLRVERQGGHGSIGGTAEQRDGRSADEIAFLLAAFGLTRATVPAGGPPADGRRR
jgi:prolyl oligopeptidase